MTGAEYKLTQLHLLRECNECYTDLSGSNFLSSLEAFRSWVAKNSSISAKDHIALTPSGKQVRFNTLSSEVSILHICLALKVLTLVARNNRLRWSRFPIISHRAAVSCLRHSTSRDTQCSKTSRHYRGPDRFTSLERLVHGTPNMGLEATRRLPGYVTASHTTV